MSLNSRIDLLWRNHLSLPYLPFWIALTPLAAAYSGAITIRERWWRSLAEMADVPIVSVGNLTVGGNGKTPFTLFLASQLRRRGLRVGIVSRGYRRVARGRAAALVSDGKRIMLDARQAGDEPAMMAKSFDGPIAVARRRIDAIRLLVERAPIDLVILDDGFQHLRLRRDLDLVLVNTARGLGNGWVLPAGPLREPCRALRRADVIVLMSSLDSRQSFPCPNEPCRPTLRAALQPRALISVEDGVWRESAVEITGQRVLAVSGLADPSGFHAMIEALGAKLTARLDYPDHYDYGPTDFANILAAAGAADLVVTTEKDLVKLERFSLAGIKLVALGIKIAMEPRDQAFLLDMVMARLQTRQAPSRVVRPEL